mmetsp:Transcript_62076/g.196286  ORF Transcript_62076/g.196286 Transcript_62076/m.196286 type:complete len:217 (-) Transcript_62076:671-1321(-)
MRPRPSYVAVCPDRRDGPRPTGAGLVHSMLLRLRSRRSSSCPLPFCPPNTRSFFPGRRHAVCPARPDIGPPSCAAIASFVSLYSQTMLHTSSTYTSCMKSPCHPPYTTRCRPPTSVEVWLQRGRGTSPWVSGADQMSSSLPGGGSFLGFRGALCILLAPLTPFLMTCHWSRMCTSPSMVPLWNPPNRSSRGMAGLEPRTLAKSNASRDGPTSPSVW